MATDADMINAIAVIAEACTAALKSDQRILLAGNGGSAAGAQHLAAELVGRLLFDRPALSALALTTDTAILTSVSNDYGYEQVFVRQIEAIGRPGDVFIAISTSGRSRNLILALKRARKKGLITISLLGGSSGEMGDWCDHRLNIPDRETQKIQEGHIVVGHILCALIERAVHPV
ncbi:MAG: phosphoheptose isomerase [Rhodospirillaceae bacterium]|nr:MAG: phosphoheptose isomerase [Rhodospirillaceae bacterium]